jgi:hypothetical protein
MMIEEGLTPPAILAMTSPERFPRTLTRVVTVVFKAERWRFGIGKELMREF